MNGDAPDTRVDNQRVDPRNLDNATRRSLINHHLAELAELMFDIDPMQQDAKTVREFIEQYERLRVMLLRLQPASSRSLNLAFTKLEESLLWLNRHMSSRAWK